MLLALPMLVPLATAISLQLLPRRPQLQRVVAFCGALAILIAVASFPGSPVVGMVVANGLVLILLGLLHVGYWRFFSATPAPP